MGVRSKAPPARSIDAADSRKCGPGNRAGRGDRPMRQAAEQVVITIRDRRGECPGVMGVFEPFFRT